MVYINTLCVPQTAWLGIVGRLVNTDLDNFCKRVVMVPFRRLLVRLWMQETASVDIAALWATILV
jgi:hypothetical protein